MERFDAHVCLVSAQATPNLLPALDERWRPQRVVLAASAQMKPAAGALERVIKGKGAGIAVEQLALPDAYDYGALSDAFMHFLDAHPGERIALNVTGGTKLMAVAAQEVFRAYSLPVFYVNVDSDEVIVIGEAARSAPLQAKLRVRELLESHGFSVESHQQPQVTSELRDLAARLVDRVGSAGRALGQLNALAAQDDALKKLKVSLKDEEHNVPALADLLDLFKDAGQLRLTGRDVHFPNEAARFFVNGGWLESHVFDVVQGLRGQQPLITDVIMNATLLHADGHTKNEIDIAFLYRNTLHLIECKTANLSSKTARDDKATEALYKMETLLKIGGLRTKGMIVDYRGALSARTDNLARAQSMGIEVVSGKQLQDLRGRISRVWLKA